MPRKLPAFPTDLDVDLTELSAAAEPWMARLAVDDQRVQASPDARNIRYYQTTGLLDKPVRYDGRVARYGLRHLLQLIAIRALQTRGLSLAQVQTTLSGSTLRELQHVVESSLGLPSTEPPVAAPSASLSPPTALVAVELGEGVVVTIDSRIHPDITRTVDALRRALQADGARGRIPNGELP